jgi:hypothetical protein
MRRKQSALLTLDGSGNGSVAIAVPTGALKGFHVILGTASSVPFTVASINRTIVAATAAATKFYPVSELVDTSAGAASTTYDAEGAIIHDLVTITVAAGTAGGTVTFALFYE